MSPGPQIVSLGVQPSSQPTPATTPGPSSAISLATASSATATSATVTSATSASSVVSARASSGSASVSSSNNGNFRPKVGGQVRFMAICVPGVTTGGASQHLNGTIQDHAQINEQMVKAGCQISSSGFSANLSQEDCLKRISAFFNEQPDKTDYYFLMYSGHGYRKYGFWSVHEPGIPDIHPSQVILDQCVAPHHLVEKWNESKGFKNGARLLLVSDSCFSGLWVKSLRGLRAERVAVQSASSEDEVAYDRESFLRLWNKNQFRPFPASTPATHPKKWVDWDPDTAQTDIRLSNTLTITFFNRP
jgi:hypothetical protein